MDDIVIYLRKNNYEGKIFMEDDLPHDLFEAISKIRKISDINLNVMAFNSKRNLVFSIRDRELWSSLELDTEHSQEFPIDTIIFSGSSRYPNCANIRRVIIRDAESVEYALEWIQRNPVREVAGDYFPEIYTYLGKYLFRDIVSWEIPTMNGDESRILEESCPKLV